MSTKSDRVQVALRVPRTVRDIIARARTILAGMAANPGCFPSPHPPLAVLAADIAELEAAERAANTLVVGAVEARNAKLQIVRDDLHMLKLYVQTVADADRANAKAIVAASGMDAQKPRSVLKPDLQAKQGAEPGTVVLTAKAAGPRVAYFWQKSVNEQIWIDLPATVEARTTVVGLAAPRVYYFRSRRLTTAGKSDWSLVVKVVVT